MMYIETIIGKPKTEIWSMCMAYLMMKKASPIKKKYDG